MFETTSFTEHLHPYLYAATVRAIGYDPHTRQFVSAGDTSWGGGSKPPARDSRGRFVKAGAR